MELSKIENEAWEVQPNTTPTFRLEILEYNGWKYHSVMCDEMKMKQTLEESPYFMRSFLCQSGVERIPCARN